MEKSEVRPLGKNIEFLCRAKRMTLQQVATACGTSKSSLHGWITGVRPTDPYKILRLSEVLGVSLLDLLMKDLSIIDKKASVWMSE